jgi:hypothetical protein
MEGVQTRALARGRARVGEPLTPSYSPSLLPSAGRFTLSGRRGTPLNGR